MGVPCQVAEDPLWPGQRWLGIDHPLHLLQRREKLVPSRRIEPSLTLPLHTEALLSGGLPQPSEEGAAEESAEDTHRQEEALGTRDPRRAIHGQAPRGDEAMEMRVMVELLAPGMEHAEQANLGA